MSGGHHPLHKGALRFAPHKRPPMTRGLSPKVTGGEKIREAQRFLSLRPFGAPPSSEGGGALEAPVNPPECV